MKEIIKHYEQTKRDDPSLTLLTIKITSYKQALNHFLGCFINDICKESQIIQTGKNI